MYHLAISMCESSAQHNQLTSQYSREGMMPGHTCTTQNCNSVESAIAVFETVQQCLTDSHLCADSVKYSASGVLCDTAKVLSSVQL